MTNEGQKMAVQTFRHGNAIVRIHPGKMTAEEIKAAFAQGAIPLLKELQRRKKDDENP